MEELRSMIEPVPSVLISDLQQLNLDATKDKELVLYNPFNALKLDDDEIADDKIEGPKEYNPSMLGDFNTVVDMSEVCGHSGDIRVAMEEFRSCIVNTSLITLPMQGCTLLGIIAVTTTEVYGSNWTGCLLMISDIWRNHIVGTAMYAVTRKLKALKLVFHALNVKLVAEFLSIAQSILQNDRHNLFLKHLENYCRLVFLKATKMEQQMMHQRAKMQWLKGGDQCARIFFRKVATRRASKRIFQISTAEGSVCTEQQDVIDELVGFYQRLLGEERRTRHMDIHHLRPYAQHIITDSEVNATLLTLIPKVQSPTTVADFRLISYCNIMYKVITKILVQQIRPLLDRLASPTQNAFIPGCSISDNILLAKELFAGYNQQRLPPRCAMKADLRKAYDTIEWDFLFAILQLFGFHPQFF
ncbi:UNVERIFIED_CONTAM: hypothetical protein Sangu_1010100 [Sesamum angustifolium]|uniref:Reverse transcriptase domain-containing protein n=1 Tax=Sesamum angustifolium TaxID=2727405 RepID=A0AAW2PGD8_9LAMI